MSCPLCAGVMHATQMMSMVAEFEDYEDEDGNTQERLKMTEDQESHIRWDCEDCKHQEREGTKGDDDG